jgi:hypothetical protein
MQDCSSIAETFSLAMTDVTIYAHARLMRKKHICRAIYPINARPLRLLAALRYRGELLDFKALCRHCFVAGHTC